MDNKQTILGIGIATLSIGLGYLGWTIMNNSSWEKIPVEKTDNIVTVDGTTLEEERVKEVGKEKKDTFLSTFWKAEFPLVSQEELDK